ncbi:endonuclease domain-containing protein [uncultured Parabacteroides sp.]|uniref:endonuclease domain-containing protein n=1 Tax=uncultured Parabacteroides sp. TaxID=512312 RepID=UPI00258FF63D|nr:endonuclease domain-containing protein [uncultured Parabacteroides sp.]
MIIHYNNHLKSLASELRNASTQSEVRFWKYLKGKQLGVRFIRQKPIGCYIVDFYCKELQLAIELDGLSHHYEETMKRDEEKENYLKKLHIDLLRFEDKEVLGDLDNVMAVIMDYIETNKQPSNP